MSKTILSAVTAVVIFTGCNPPPPVPPPRFQLQPQEPVDSYEQTTGPSVQNPDPYGQGTQTNPNSDQTSLRPGEYPIARPTANKNQVISPYEPFNVIDVEGFSSGQLARDPSNKKIFRVP